MAKKIKRKDLIGAKRRGMLNKEQVDRIKPRRHTRICIMCGGPFLPFDGGRREMFGCGCCAVVCDIDRLDRRIYIGVRVIFIPTGEAGHVLTVKMYEDAEPAALVRFEKGGEIEATAMDLERVHDRKVTHYGNCRHGRRVNGNGEGEESHGEGYEDEGQ